MLLGPSLAIPAIRGPGGGQPLVVPGALLAPLTLFRSQSAGVESTALASNGTTWQTYAADIARFNGTAQRLLIGGARTNSITNPRQEGSAVGTPGTNPSGSWSRFGHPAGVTISIEAVGTLADGRRYGDYRWAGTPGSTTSGRLTFGPVTATASQAWAAACDVALVGGTLTNVSVLLGWYENDSVPAFLRNADATISPTATLTRYTFAGTTGASTAHILPNLRLVFTSGLAVDFTLRVVWPTLEQATFASTPILPPVGSPAASTRGADLISATLASLGIGANGACTVLWSGMIPQAGPTGINQLLFQIDSGTDANRFSVLNANGGTALLPVRTLASAFLAGSSAGSFTVNVPFACGATFAGGRCALSYQGNTVTEVTGGPTSGLTNFRLGGLAAGLSNLFGETARLSILPYALSDAALQAAVAAFPTA